MITLFDKIANSITAGDLADKVIVADVGDSLEGIWESLMEQGAWFCIVRDKDRDIGNIPFDQESIDSDKVIDHVETILPCKVISADTRVLDALEILQREWFLFCQRKNEICGVLTRDYYDKLSFKYCLFAITLEIEELLTHALIARGILDSKIFSTLDPKRVGQIERKVRAESQYHHHTVAYLYFSEKINLFLNREEIRKLRSMGIASPIELFAKMCKLRNLIAHGMSITDLVKDPDQMIEITVEMNKTIKHLRFFRNIQERNFDEL